ncbi:MAG: C-type lectin domain-containing protein [Deltaproteobacteria bacterium]|nr:C-type lectin domain-containing protein [Deltaproteobacteria bacterium]
MNRRLLSTTVVCAVVGLAAVLPATACSSFGEEGGPTADAGAQVEAGVDAEGGAVVDAAPESDARPLIQACQGGVTKGCFTLVPARSRDAAVAACAGLDGHLATFASRDEQREVERAVGRSPSKSYWFGLVGPPGLNEKAQYSWVTREPVTYDDWGGTNPNEGSGCAIIEADSGTWADRPCSDAFEGICEIE